MLSGNVLDMDKSFFVFKWQKYFLARTYEGKRNIPKKFNIHRFSFGRYRDASVNENLCPAV